MLGLQDRLEGHGEESKKGYLSATTGRLHNGKSITAPHRYTAFRDALITCPMRPEEPISEPVLAKRYQTSRTPVREACNLFHKEGLLDAIPHKEFFVPGMTLQVSLRVTKACKNTIPDRPTANGEAAREAMAKHIRGALKHLLSSIFHKRFSLQESCFRRSRKKTRERALGRGDKHSMLQGCA